MYKIFNKAVTGITCDSRKVKSGNAFFIMEKSEEACVKYGEEALRLGASIIVSEYADHLTDLPRDKLIFVEDIFKALRESLDIICPKYPDYLIAATGTNGKSSVVNYFQQIISLLGELSLCSGTIGVRTNVHGLAEKFLDKQNLTTRDLVYNRSILHEAKVNGVKYAALEASSHGIVQKRLDGIKYDTIIFTNITWDHIDYHKTFENYENAKFKLVDSLKESGYIVTSKMFADKYSNRLVGKNLMTIGYENSDISYNVTFASLSHQEVSLKFNGKAYNFHTKLIGDFQISNLLMSIAAVYRAGFELEDILKVVNKIDCVDGRLQHLHNKGRHVFVDYAHTEDGLHTVLSTLSKFKSKNSKLFVLFGCGGDKDKSRRAKMGLVASRLADGVIITDDNPRSEDPAQIRNAIIQNCENATEIEGREKAIEYAISRLREGDILLLAGKGHENYQIIGNTTLYFNDKEVAEKYLFAL